MLLALFLFRFHFTLIKRLVLVCVKTNVSHKRILMAGIFTHSYRRVYKQHFGIFYTLRTTCKHIFHSYKRRCTVNSDRMLLFYDYILVAATSRRQPVLYGVHDLKIHAHTEIYPDNYQPLHASSPIFISSSSALVRARREYAGTKKKKFVQCNK